MDTNTNNSKANYVLSGSILIAAILIAGSVIYSKGLGVSGTAKSGDNSDAFEVKKDDIILGDAKAPVTIFLYSDPSCPFCAAADGADILIKDNTGKDIHIISEYLKKGDPTWIAPIPGIIENYVNTGKARLIYRYYPGHGTGEGAMKILYCANEQGKFWELHKVIADNQAVVADTAKVKELASGMGVDISKVDSCLQSGKYDQKIAADTELGKKAGVNGTPGFFINKVSKAGAYSFNELKTVIEAALLAK